MVQLLNFSRIDFCCDTWVPGILISFGFTLCSQGELELLLLDRDEPNHFNFKKIQEEEGGMQSKRKQKTKQRKEKQKTLDKAAEDNFQVIKSFCTVKWETYFEPYFLLQSKGNCMALH